MSVKDNLLGKTVVITGCTSGIGFETAKEMIKCGAFVIGVGREQSRCQQAEEEIRRACSDAEILFLTADLSSLKQVKELARNIRRKVEIERKEQIDVLVNNAGAVSSWYVGTSEGFELQFTVNHLAPFLLTYELMPLLKAAPTGRVITVSSGSHYRTKMNWNDVLMRKHYSCLKAYKQSKLANVLFTAELNRRLGTGSTVRAFAVDPGLVNTNIGLKGTAGIERWVWVKRSKGGVNPSVPAASIVYLASEQSIQDSGYIYWKDCAPKKPSRYSQREDVAARLWELSKKMCGIEGGN